MNIDQIRNRVRHIDNLRRDNEAAHSEEDTLYTDVLEAIADGSPNAAALAEEALRTKNIDFARWCA